MKSEMDIKDALLEIISCMLSPNTDLRGVAEERRKALEVTEEYAGFLSDILLTPEECLEERQMAGVLLKQYVRNHWTEAEDFVPPAANEIVKQKLRSNLPNGLRDPIGKIRNTCAIILVFIAKSDYPCKWPDMIEVILSKLEPGDENTCSGILSFIRDFSRLARCSQISESTEKVYPFLYGIVQELKYSTQIRSKAILQFANFPCELSLVKGDKGVITDMVLNFCKMCEGQLLLFEVDRSDLLLKAQILKAYSILLSKMPPFLKKAIVESLPSFSLLLYNFGVVFGDMLANDSYPYRDYYECLDDTPLFYTVVYNIFELLQIILNVKPDLPLMVLEIRQIVYYTILFMAIPQDTEDRWKNDPDLYFSEDVDEECFEKSVRIETKQFLLVLVNKFDRHLMISALTNAVEQHIMSCKDKSESFYWRIMEATIYAVGVVKNFIFELHHENQLQNFNIKEYLNQWASELGPCPSWLMLARILWIGGRYALLLGCSNISTYVMSIAHNLSEPSFILRYSAIRSLLLHLQTIHESEHKFVYMELLNALAHPLIGAVNHLQGDILHVGLVALEKLVKLDPAFMDTIQNELITLIINIFGRNVTCLKVVKNLHPIIKLVCMHVNSQRNFENKFVLIFVNILNNVVLPDNRQLTSFEAQCNAIEILNMLVKYSFAPISENLIIYGFVTVSNYITTADDSGITQSGADCLRSFLYNGTKSLIEFRDNEGRSGTYYILNVLKYVLDPLKLEFASKQVARFFITAMHNLGPQLDQHFSFLLRGVLSSMQRANTVAVEESLLIIFAYLFYYHLEAVINYLTSIPGPDGESALAFIFDKWLSKNYIYEGRYQRNLNVLALSRVIEYSLIQEDKRVADIKVKQYTDVHEYENVFPTSKDNGYYAEVPVLLIIIKRLVYILQMQTTNLTETAMVLAGSNEGEDIDTESLPLKGLEPLRICPHSFSSHSTLSDGPDCESDSEDSSETLDPLDVTDPIYNVKTGEYLSNFLKNCSENQHFIHYAQYLNIPEKEFLSKVGMDVNRFSKP